MQFKEGTDVFTIDGDKVGSIDRVVIDPRNNEVTHLVVRKGFFFPTDKVVPMDLVRTAEAWILILSINCRSIKSSRTPNLKPSMNNGKARSSPQEAVERLLSADREAQEQVQQAEE